MLMVSEEILKTMTWTMEQWSPHLIHALSPIAQGSNNSAHITSSYDLLATSSYFSDLVYGHFVIDISKKPKPLLVKVHETERWQFDISRKQYLISPFDSTFHSVRSMNKVISLVRTSLLFFFYIYFSCSTQVKLKRTQSSVSFLFQKFQFHDNGLNGYHDNRDISAIKDK